MSVFIAHKIILLACLLSLAEASPDAIKEFKEIQHDVFSEDAYSIYEYSIEKMIEKMIKLIESGEVPVEVQGTQNLEYLKSLESECTFDIECNIEEDLAKLKRLNKTTTKAKNFYGYLQVCQRNVRYLCAPKIYERVKSTLDLDQQTTEAVEALASEVQWAYRDVDFSHRATVDGLFQTQFYSHVLSAMRRLDPKQSRKVAKKWIIKGHSLKVFIDIIRSSCVIFLEKIDRVVELWPAWHSRSDSPWDMLPKLHYTLKCCKKVVNDWDEIVKVSRYAYDEYLI